RPLRRDPPGPFMPILQRSMAGDPRDRLDPMERGVGAGAPFADRSRRAGPRLRVDGGGCALAHRVTPRVLPRAGAWMSDYLGRLAARTLGLAPTVEASVP